MGKAFANPFPGVNPYVESEGYWEDFHGAFVPCLRETILAALPDHYDGRVKERMLVLLPDHKEQRSPDVAVIQRDDPRHFGGGGGLAVADVAAGAALLEMMPIGVREKRETWIEIVDAAASRSSPRSRSCRRATRAVAVTSSSTASGTSSCSPG